MLPRSWERKKTYFDSETTTYDVSMTFTFWYDGTPYVNVVPNHYVVPRTLPMLWFSPHCVDIVNYFKKRHFDQSCTQNLKDIF